MVCGPEVEGFWRREATKRILNKVKTAITQKQKTKKLIGKIKSWVEQEPGTWNLEPGTLTLPRNSRFRIPSWPARDYFLFFCEGIF